MIYLSVPFPQTCQQPLLADITLSLHQKHVQLTKVVTTFFPFMDKSCTFATFHCLFVGISAKKKCLLFNNPIFRVIVSSPMTIQSICPDEKNFTFTDIRETTTFNFQIVCIFEYTHHRSSRSTNQSVGSRESHRSAEQMMLHAEKRVTVLKL